MGPSNSIKCVQLAAPFNFERTNLAHPPPMRSPFNTESVGGACLQTVKGVEFVINHPALNIVETVDAPIRTHGDLTFVNFFAFDTIWQGHSDSLWLSMQSDLGSGKPDAKKFASF